MKHKLFFLILLLNTFPILGQNKFEEFRKQKQQEFKAFRDKRAEDFNEYRRERNKQFAEYVSKRWSAFQAMKGVERPISPKPKDPIFYKGGLDIPDDEKIPIKGVTSVPVSPIKKTPIDLPPVKNDPIANKKKQTFIFLNTHYSIAYDKYQRVNLQSLSEAAIGRCMKEMCKAQNDDFFNDCIITAHNAGFNGWASYLFAKSISEKVQGKTNEAIILQNLLLIQMGYDTRICKVGNSLHLMIASDITIAQTPYINLHKRNYYIMEVESNSVQVHTYEKNMEKAVNYIDFANAEEISLSYLPTPERVFQSKEYPEMNITVSTNRNLVDFYKQMPILGGTPWGLYTRQPFEEQTGNQVLTQLAHILSGKDKITATAMLLNWIQTGFSYKTDGEQFGYEKPFFKEEIFYYPYCDCEDRSILFCYLVHELLGLDAVLIFSPGHLFSAVAFDQDIKGDYLMLNGKKYIICDPTFIGAGIGECMPSYKTKKLDIIKIYS